MDDIRYDADDLKKCLTLLQEGNCILLPTETGWALCASSQVPAGVQTLRNLAMESGAQPLTVLVSDEGSIERLATDIPEVAWELLEVSDRPLTLILDQGRNIPLHALSDSGEIALRLVKERFFRDLIARLKAPLICSAIAPFPTPEAVPGKWKSDAVYTSSYKRSQGLPFPKEYRIKLGRGGLVHIIS